MYKIVQRTSAKILPHTYCYWANPCDPVLLSPRPGLYLRMLAAKGTWNLNAYLMLTYFQESCIAVNMKVCVQSAAKHSFSFNHETAVCDSRTACGTLKNLATFKVQRLSVVLRRCPARQRLWRHWHSCMNFRSAAFLFCHHIFFSKAPLHSNLLHCPCRRMVTCLSPQWRDAAASQGFLTVKMFNKTERNN